MRDRKRLGLVRYFAATVLVRSADEGARISLVLLALERTGSAAEGGLLVASLLVPHVVAAPPVGAAIDRAARPRLVLASAIGGLAAGLTTAALLIGRAPSPAVAVVLLIAGCCGPAVSGGLTAQLPRLVDAGRMQRAFGLDSLFYNVASTAGPALVGIVAATTGADTAQLVLAAFAAISALLVLTLPLGRSSGTERPPAPLLAGAAEILHDPTLRAVTASSTVGQLGPGALGVVAAVVATALHSPAAAGLLLSVLAAGSFIGSALWTLRPLPAEVAPLVTTLSMAGTGVALAVSSALTPLWAVAAAFAFAGVFVGPFAAALFTVRARYSTPETRAQVFTIGAGLKTTASALGAAAIGLAAGLPPATQLLLVAASPLLAGLTGTIVLARGATSQRVAS